jgi:hypothetical protein
VQPGCTRRSLPKDQFKREVEKELTGRESEPWEIIYFKVYKSQIPAIEQAIDTAALMLGQVPRLLSGDDLRRLLGRRKFGQWEPRCALILGFTIFQVSAR